MLVNAYVFVWREEGALTGLGLQAAAIGQSGGPLPPVADPPEEACGGDPVRVFEGLEDLVHLDTTLSGAFTLRLALLHLGVNGEEIDRIEAAVRDKVDLGLLGGSGAPLRVAADRFGTVHALEIELAEGHLLQACRSQEGDELFSVRNIQHPLRSDVVVVPLELGKDADLAAAVDQAGEKPELAALIARTLAADLDLREQSRPGDKLQVMVEKRWLGRRFHRYGAILAIRFRGTAGRFAYYRYKPEGGDAAFFDDEGQPMRRARLRSPVGWHRVDPEARGLLAPSVEVVEGRLGVVYRLPEGAPIVALGDGMVRNADRTLEEGNFLDLELEDGTIVRYAHLMRTIGELTPGTAVRQGQVVALAGHSGRTPYDRLRLEMWADVDGTMQTIDPMRPGNADAEVSPSASPILEAQRAQFEKDIAPWRRALRLAAQ